MRILKADFKSLNYFSQFQSEDSRCLLSVYFPGSDARASLPVSLQDLPEEVLRVSDLSEDEQEHLQQNLTLWQQATEDLSLPDAPGWFAVISWMNDVADFVPLPKPPKLRAVLASSPFLYPAGRLLDDYESYAVLYADHSRAVLYEAVLGRLEEKKRIRGDIKNHVKKGGWSQARYERRRDNEIHHFCESIAERLQALVESESLDRVVLAGDDQLLNELEEHLDQGLRERIVDRLAVDDPDDEENLFSESLKAAFEEEKREEKRLLKQIRAAHAANGKAALGPNAVLAALREHRVAQLLIGPMVDAAFWRCHECGASDLGEPTKCPACGKAETFQESASNQFTDLAFEGGSLVQFTEAEIQEVGGVAAMLRW